MLLQHFEEVDDVESWLREKQRVLAGGERGRDEAGSEVLLRRHTRLHGEISSAATDIQRLDKQASGLITRAPEIVRVVFS